MMKCNNAFKILITIAYFLLIFSGEIVFAEDPPCNTYEDSASCPQDRCKWDWEDESQNGIEECLDKNYKYEESNATKSNSNTTDKSKSNNNSVKKNSCNEMYKASLCVSPCYWVEELKFCIDENQKKSLDACGIDTPNYTCDPKPACKYTEAYNLCLPKTFLENDFLTIGQIDNDEKEAEEEQKKDPEGKCKNKAMEECYRLRDAGEGCDWDPQSNKCFFGTWEERIDDYYYQPEIKNNNVDNSDDMGNIDLEKLCNLDLYDDLKKAWTIICIIAPILVILMGSLDFVQAVIAQDEQQMKKSTSKFAKRLIFAVLLFFLPWFVRLIFDISGLEIKVQDILCGL